jgi:hypothetical protein
MNEEEKNADSSTTKELLWWAALNRRILHGRNGIATAEEWRKRNILHPFGNCIFIFHSCRFLPTICPYNEFNDQIGKSLHLDMLGFTVCY